MFTKLLSNNINEEEIVALKADSIKFIKDILTLSKVSSLSRKEKKILTRITN